MSCPEPVADTLSTAAAKLQAVTAALPGGGEHRPGQLAMAEAVAQAIGTGRHLVVQAGTGTGKSLAYLVPAVCSGRKVVVATATKALQDQLAGKELPFLARHLDVPFSFAVLKGRSNYLCLQRAAEMRDPAPGEVEVALPGLDADAADDPAAGPHADDDPAAGELRRVGEVRGFGDQVRALLAWSETSGSGDRAELPFEPHPRAWAALSVGRRECPGAFRCPSGPRCFAEAARERAAAADVVVVNTHLYTAHVASGGVVLPDHDVVVLDEAHQVEDVVAAGLGVEITGGRLRALATAARAALGDAGAEHVEAVVEVAGRLEEALAPLVGRRVRMDGTDRSDAGSAADTGRSDTGRSDGGGAARHAGERPGGPAGLHEVVLGSVLQLTASRVRTLADELRRDGEDRDGDGRRARAVLAASHLVDDLTRVVAADADQVAWVEQATTGRSAAPCLRMTPVEVAPLLAEALWPEVTAVLTSATVPPLLEQRLGLPASTDRLDVGSPFPYRQHAVLYVPTHLPDRRSPRAEAAIHEEMQQLMRAAGGRTLALFTSWRAMQQALAALRPLLPFPILAQGELPKARLVRQFEADEATCLFATLSFWQGVDVPGPTLSLVVLDRLPFPRPDDPLLQARRDRAGPRAFATVDVPRAATLLAQGAGRLIRSSTDRGVVAVLDPRLAKASYRRELLAAVPPMRRSVERAEAIAALREAAGSGTDTGGSG